MKNSYLFFLSIILACSSVNLKGVHKSDGFAISNYKTFNFFEVDVSGDAIGPNHETNLKLIKEAITKQMASKGVTPTTDNPQLLVNIGIVVSEKVQTRETSFTNPADRTAYMGQRNYTWESQEVEVGTYREGTVTLDLVDRATNKLVWQGSVESILPNKEQNIPPLIEEGMQKLFTKIN